MKIVVLVKQVPDSDDVRLDPKTGNLQREGVHSKINTTDRNVLEEAMYLKEKYGAEVTAVTMGPPQAKAVLMKALAFGCDDAVLLSDRVFGGADTLATSYTLSEAIRKIGNVDLVMAGRNSEDGDTAQVGAAVAAFLDLPHITLVSSADVSDGWVYCNRTLENHIEKVRAKLPALICITKDANTPRYPSPYNILNALDKPVTVWNADSIMADRSRTGTAGSPSATKKVYEPEKKPHDIVIFTGTVQEKAKQLVDIIREQNLL